jgi:hypothetical protein
MNMHRMPWIDLAPLTTQRCYHLAWFLYGWIEREQVINLNACAAWSLQLMKPSTARLPSPSGAEASGRRSVPKRRSTVR